MKESKTVLIAGPWLGEFGWELFAWQGYVRALSEYFDETVCISRKNSKHLYTDFAKQVIAYDRDDGVPDMFFMPNVKIDGALFNEIIQQNKVDVTNKTVTWFPARKIGQPPMTHYSEDIGFGDLKIKPKYVIFENEFRKYDYVFHIRDRPLRKEDNWSIEKWVKLLELLTQEKKTVACIGTQSSSGWIPGTDDLRGIPMDELIGVLSNAGHCFGPSSGPMHLASLCGTPHVVWSIMYNHPRYTENWNPHGTPVLFLGDYDWHPSAEYIYQQYKTWTGEKT